MEMMEKFYNATIAYSASTSKILQNLEKLGCPNTIIVQHTDEVIDSIFSTLPTFADVFDWLLNKGYSLHIEPASTFSTINHNAWWWVLETYDMKDAYDKTKYTGTDIFGHWDECVLEGIKKAIELLLEEKNK